MLTSEYTSLLSCEDVIQSTARRRLILTGQLQLESVSSAPNLLQSWFDLTGRYVGHRHDWRITAKHQRSLSPIHTITEETQVRLLLFVVLAAWHGNGMQHDQHVSLCESWVLGGSRMFWDVLGCSMFWGSIRQLLHIIRSKQGFHGISWHFMAFHGMAPGIAGR